MKAGSYSPYIKIAIFTEIYYLYIYINVEFYTSKKKLVHI